MLSLNHPSIAVTQGINHLAQVHKETTVKTTCVCFLVTPGQTGPPRSELFGYVDQVSTDWMRFLSPNQVNVNQQH